MAWKTEKWLSEVFPGRDNIYAEYRHLSGRELAIVSAGVLDLALAELLSKRLVNNPKEYEGFLGLNEDGRAPAATFGARIQLALLVGLIDTDDAPTLRIIKNIRNKFAHRINVDFTSPHISPLILDLHSEHVARTKRLVRGWRAASSERPETVRPPLGGLWLASSETLESVRPHLTTTPEAGAGLLLAVFSIYQAYFHLLSDLVWRIPNVHRRISENEKGRSEERP